MKTNKQHPSLDERIAEAIKRNSEKSGGEESDNEAEREKKPGESGHPEIELPNRPRRIDDQER